MRAVLSTLFVACVIAVPSHAYAQIEIAIAEQRIDVDGDGKVDVVRLDDTASVSILVTGKQALDAWTPFTTTGSKLVGGTIATAVVNKRVLIAATAQFGSERRGQEQVSEAMALEYRAGKLTELWRGAVGPIGRDREHSLHLDLTSTGLVRYQSRASVTRCDGKTAYLFREGYDFKAKEFRSVYNQHAIVNAAGTLTATRTPPALAPSGSAVFRASGASHQRGASDASELTPPREIDDGDVSTAWVEGLGGDGSGEFVTVTTNMAGRAVAAIRIVPGDASSAAAFKAANRLAKVGLLVGDQLAYWIEFPVDPLTDAGDYFAPYWVQIPETASAAVDCVTLVIAELYPGTDAKRARSGVTAISELAVLSDLDMSEGGADAALAQQVASGGDTGASAARMLRSRGEAAALALLAEVQKAGLTKAQILDLRRALAGVAHPSGVSEIVAGLATASLSDGDRELFAGGLAAIGDDAVDPITEILSDDVASEDVRIAAAEALGRIATDRSRRVLLAAAGTGTRELRRHISLRIGAQPDAIDDILAAIAAAESAGELGREADLWRAMSLWSRVASLSELATPSIGRRRLIARLGSATDYELRYRLYQLAGSLEGDAAVIEALTASIVETEQTAHGTALRRVAADALARNESAAARPLVLALADDPDPGVRARAAIGLAERTDADEESDAALIGRLQTDHWPHVRRVAASGLGQRCDRVTTTATALYTAVQDDVDIDVRREAMVALVACRAPGVGQHLIDVASDSGKPIALRQRALSLIGALGDVSLADAALELLVIYKKRAWSDESALRLAAAAISAVGKLAAKPGIEKLLDIAAEQAFPELQAAAATALGETCPGKAKPVFDSLVTSPERAVSIAAKSALNKCNKLWFPDD